MSALAGIGVSPGIALGRALVIHGWEADVPRYLLPLAAVRDELGRFWAARREAREEIRALREQTARRLGAQYAAIFDAHLLVLEDRKLGRELVARMRQQRMNAEWALASTLGRILDAMQQAADAGLRERGTDVRDVYERLLRILGGQVNRHASRLELAADTVVVAQRLSPSDAVWLHQPRVVGFVTETGGPSSHIAILANALEIPAVLGVEDATAVIRDQDDVVVDGIQGRVILRPTPGVSAACVQERDDWLACGRAVEVAPGPVATSDGVAVRLLANIGFPEELTTVRRVGAEGIGLYRSEFLFLSAAPALPSEDDYYATYLKIATGVTPGPAVIRTLDLGGEKSSQRIATIGDANPALGLRAVRFCLNRPDIFRTQLRGLLRAAVEAGNVSILVPMVSGLEQWRAVIEFFEQVRRELTEEGLPAPRTPLGVMVELPAAALVVEHLAREADFLSVGTNDLIQYTLAVDRNNGQVAELYDPWHPAVLGLIARTVAAGRQAGIPVSLCGEMASNPLGALTLLGLGLEELSCNPLVIPGIRAVLRGASAAEARAAAAAALEQASGAEARAVLEERFAAPLGKWSERRRAAPLG